MEAAQTPQQREQPVGCSLYTICLAAFLAALIAAAGALLGDALKTAGNELVVTQVLAQEQSELLAAQNKELRSKAIQLLCQYAFAYADAAINFQTIPKLDGKLALKIAPAMPQQVEITGMLFEGENLVLTCNAITTQAGQLFYEQLHSIALFEAVTCVNNTPAGVAPATFELVCAPLKEV